MSSEPLQSNDLKKPSPASIAYYVRAVHDYAPSSSHSSDMEQSDDGKRHAEEPRPAKKPRTEDKPLLAFKAGDVIRVSHKDESGWWWGVKFSMDSKETVGNPGWLPSDYVEDFYSTIDGGVEDPVLQSWQHMAAYPADWLNYCYAAGVKPEEAATKSEQEPKHFLGQPLLVPSTQEQAKNELDPTDRSCKVMDQFFDYNTWNEEMNRKNPLRRKAKPNPKLKKKKKLNW